MMLLLAACAMTRYGEAYLELVNPTRYGFALFAVIARIPWGFKIDALRGRILRWTVIALFLLGMSGEIMHLVRAQRAFLDAVAYKK